MLSIPVVQDPRSGEILAMVLVECAMMTFAAAFVGASAARPGSVDAPEATGAPESAQASESAPGPKCFHFGYKRAVSSAEPASSAVYRVAGSPLLERLLHLAAQLGSHRLHLDPK